MLPNKEKSTAPESPSRRTRCPWFPPRRVQSQWQATTWGRPTRHWFFMRILFFFFWFGVILTIAFFLFGGLSFHNIMHAFWIVFLVMALGGMVLGRMFRPLRVLMLGVHEISNGNLDFQFPVKGRRGEIWYLADQFNQMVGHIKEMIHSKDQLLLDVSHELRSPLTRLKVALEMSPKGKMRESMMRDIAEMETMLSEVLETERLRSGNGKLSLGPVDLAVVVGETIKKYKGRKPGLKLMGTPEKLTVTADLARVRTVFQNVMENALKYSNNQKKAVEISLKTDEKNVLVTVQDFGPGIPEEEQGKIFEPFYRVDKSRTKETGGYGLGLSLCREIMEAHGGEIHLDSEPGNGTEISLRFPIEKKN